MLKALARFRRSHEFWLLMVILVLGTVLSLVTNSFLTLRNLSDLLTSNAYVGILCSGLVVVLIAGGIDISFTATAGVAQYAALTLANRYDMGWLTVFLVAAGVGTLLGMVNAFVIYKFKIKSIIATIALLNVYFGLLIWGSGGTWITDLPEWFLDGVSWLEVTGEDNYTYSVNLQLLVLILSFVMTWVLLQRSNWGRQIYAMGGNPDAAQRLGFNIFRLHLIVYGYLGFITGLASIVQAQLAQTVMPSRSSARSWTCWRPSCSAVPAWPVASAACSAPSSAWRCWRSCRTGSCWQGCPPTGCSSSPVWSSLSPCRRRRSRPAGGRSGAGS